MCHTFAAIFIHLKPYFTLIKKVESILKCKLMWQGIAVSGFQQSPVHPSASGHNQMQTNSALWNRLFITPAWEELFNHLLGNF